MPVIVRSFAKINLGLSIGALRPDGFHDLRTVYQSIALHHTSAVPAGHGEEVYPLPDLPATVCVVATPEIGVSTPQAFADWDGMMAGEGAAGPGALRSPKAGSFDFSQSRHRSVPTRSQAPSPASKLT